MRKSIKITILFVCILFLTGCDVSYNINIDEQLNVEEVVIGVEDNLIIQKRGDKKEGHVQFLMDTLNQVGELGSYTKTVIYNPTTSGVRISRNYTNINDYNNNSVITDQLFSSFDIIRRENKITINAIANYVSQSTSNVTIDVAVINIKVPYTVISHNADKVNEKDNIYSWRMSKNNNKKPIKITYATIDNYKVNNTFSLTLENSGYYFLIALIILAICVGIWLLLQNKKNNKI